MGKPVVGMLCLGSSPRRRLMQGKYVKALRRAGARVRILDTQPADLARAVARAVAECDGFLMPGGPDIDPALYHCAKQEGCGEINPVRDRYEFALMPAVLASGKPVLCICRGIQLLNVICGGTLQQDITPAQQVPHQDSPHRAKGTHTVTVAPGSRLAGMVGAGEVKVNSMHHQAVEKIGAGLQPTAVSCDGYIEGLEKQGETFCVGVQWHPEHMVRLCAQQRGIFVAFVKACAERKQSGKNK